MSLQEQLSQWSSEGKFDEIIEAVGSVPESELDLFTLCQLALAYNNTNQLQKSIDLLMGVWDIGEENPIWNYYLGYALVFSGRREEAREHLMRAREQNPEIPAQKILHFCVCYDGEDTPIDDKVLTGWVCDMLGGELAGDGVLLPELDVHITPWIETLGDGKPCPATINFSIATKSGSSFFECCVGLGDTQRDAITAAVGSFYIGFYSALERMCHREKMLDIKDARGRTWGVYIGEVVGMGANSMVTLEHYWELLEQAIPNYLGGQSPVYIKLYGARNGEHITSEVRVNDYVSHGLSDLLREPVSRWDDSQFASHKQFFFLECEEAMEPYPYTQEQISDGVRQTVELFCTEETSYDNIFDTLAQRLGDVSLASELHAFVPEICAEMAFENVTSGDEVHISAGERKIECTKWQVTSLRMIERALIHGFENNLYPENAFRECVGVSSTWSVICQARENGHDLVESGGSIQRYYNFDKDYVLR